MNQEYYLGLVDESEREVVADIFKRWLTANARSPSLSPIIISLAGLSCVVCEQNPVVCDPEHETCEQRMMFHVAECLMKWWSEQQ